MIIPKGFLLKKKYQYNNIKVFHIIIGYKKVLYTYVYSFFDFLFKKTIFTSTVKHLNVVNS